ncbi:TonB family protein [Caulobacter sp.]|uniref:TonB family protein n=1 Tax=Caulobacter sp. TaxID=78 RepID=UPI003BAC9FB8
MIVTLALAAMISNAAPAKAAMDMLVPASQPREAVAILNCMVTNDGHLTGCTVQGESSPELGVGDAALKMASRFQIDLLGPDGKSRAGTYIEVPVRIRIR